MQQLQNLESLVDSWYKNLPHLPEVGRKWLTTNVWWLVLIGVILGAIALLGVLMVTFLASTALFVVGGSYGALAGGLVVIATLLFLALGIVCLIIAGMAIAPLKAGQKKGWTLLFIGVLINVAALVISFLFNFNFFGLVWGLLMTAVGAYFLFEVRDHFVSIPAKRATVKKAS